MTGCVCKTQDGDLETGRHEKETETEEWKSRGAEKGDTETEGERTKGWEYRCV